MKDLKRLIILNPAGRNQKAGREFNRLRPELLSLLGSFELYMTRGPGDARSKVEEVLREKSFDQIIVAGGDGSLNEALQGYMNKGKSRSQKIPLGVVNLGTGGDFYRTLVEMNPNYREALRVNSFQPADVGVLRADFPEKERYFLNAASIGMGADVLQRVKNSPVSGGAFAYTFHGARSLLRHKPHYCSVALKRPDGTTIRFEDKLLNFFVCNGRYNGGGMNWNPGGSITDGVLNLTMITYNGRYDLLWNLPSIYNGKIKNLSIARFHEATEIRLMPAHPDRPELDGELPEFPMDRPRELVFLCLPAALPLVM